MINWEVGNNKRVVGAKHHILNCVGNVSGEIVEYCDSSGVKYKWYAAVYEENDEGLVYSLDEAKDLVYKFIRGRVNKVIGELQAFMDEIYHLGVGDIGTCSVDALSIDGRYKFRDLYDIMNEHGYDGLSIVKRVLSNEHARNREITDKEFGELTGVDMNFIWFCRRFPSEYRKCFRCGCAGNKELDSRNDEYYKKVVDIRVNCKKAGEPGHQWCGWCTVHNKPRMECGCTCHNI